MSNQPTLFSITSRYRVRILLPAADFAVVIDNASGRTVATGTRAACVEFAESLDRRSKAKAAADEARGTR